MSAVGDSEVMSQDAPTDWIRPPKLENRLASQSARKTLCLNGVRGDARVIPGRGVASFMAIDRVAPASPEHGQRLAFDDDGIVAQVHGRRTLPKRQSHHPR